MITYPPWICTVATKCSHTAFRHAPLRLPTARRPVVVVVSRLQHGDIACKQLTHATAMLDTLMVQVAGSLCVTHCINECSCARGVPFWRAAPAQGLPDDHSVMR